MHSRCKRKQKDTLYIDLHKRGAKCIPYSTLFPKIEEADRTRKIKRLTHLLMVTDFLEKDCTRNNGGQLIIAETICKQGHKEDVSVTLACIKSKLSRGSVTAASRRRFCASSRTWR